MAVGSSIVIAADIPAALEDIRRRVTNERLIEIVRIGEKESFKVDDAKLAVEKAYIADEVTKVIVLAAEQFSTVVQNKLLKILEEPPPRTEFILVTSSKAALLPTVRSRLPLRTFGNAREEEVLELDVARLSLASVYEFVQKHKRDDARTVRALIESIAKAAIQSRRFSIDEGTLKVFEDAIKALDSGTVPAFALNAVLLKLLAKMKR